MAHEHEHRSPREIERELDATRARIDARARELRDRLDPSEITAGVVRRLQGSNARAFFDNLGRNVRDHPVPLLLTGFGLAWLAKVDSESPRSWDEPASSGWDDDAGEPGLGAKLRDTAGSVRSRAREARLRAGSARRRAARRGEALKSRLIDRADRVQDQWERVVEEQPLLVGLVGLALGAAVGALLPATEREDEWMGEASDELKLRAAEQGRRAAEKAREAVAAEHASNGGRRGQGGDGLGERPESGSSSGSGIGGTFAGPNPGPAPGERR